MPWGEIILGAIDLVGNLIDRAKQSGELTPEEEDALEAKAQATFAKFRDAPPPPEGHPV